MGMNYVIPGEPERRDPGSHDNANIFMGSRIFPHYVREFRDDK